jgi:hypothetical protein
MDKSTLAWLVASAATIYCIGKKHEENQKKLENKKKFENKKKIVEQLIEYTKDANAKDSVSFS